MLYNMREYHRPASLDEALRLLQRKEIRTVPLAGGSGVVGQGNPDIEAVVDLQDLELDFIEHSNGTLRVGAMVRLQTIVEDCADIAQGLLSGAAHRMAGWNMRNSATIGGSLAGAQVDSPLSVVLAALGAQVNLTGNGAPVSWAELAIKLRQKPLSGELITAVMIEHAAVSGGVYHQVGRTPADLPIVNTAAVVKGQDITLAIGGLTHDLLTLHAGVSEKENLFSGVAAAEEAHIRSDFLGGAEYRRSIAGTLAQRAVDDALMQAGG